MSRNALKKIDQNTKMENNDRIEWCKALSCTLFLPNYQCPHRFFCPLKKLTKISILLTYFALVLFSDLSCLRLFTIVSYWLCWILWLIVNISSLYMGLCSIASHEIASARQNRCVCVRSDGEERASKMMKKKTHVPSIRANRFIWKPPS